MPNRARRRPGRGGPERSAGHLAQEREPCQRLQIDDATGRDQRLDGFQGESPGLDVHPFPPAGYP